MATATRKANGKSELHTIEVGRTLPPQIGTFGVVEDQPWTAEVTIKGTSSLVFHRWTVDEGDGNMSRKRGVKEKTDDVEGYVYRDEDGDICLPGEYVRRAMQNAAKYRRDPRSSRAAATELFKAGVVCETELASMGTGEWDYLDRRRAVVQRAGITRTRPAFKPGWEAALSFSVILPEYIGPQLFLDVLGDAGRYVGIGEMRPQYGRFAVVRFEVTQE